MIISSCSAVWRCLGCRSAFIPLRSFLPSFNLLLSFSNVTMRTIFASSAALFARLAIAGSASCGDPTATTLNGTYYGYHNAFYNEDFFLGIPYAQPPVNNLRYAAPESLNSSWTEEKNATEYGYECVGYGVIVLSEPPSCWL